MGGCFEVELRLCLVYFVLKSLSCWLLCIVVRRAIGLPPSRGVVWVWKICEVVRKRNSGMVMMIGILRSSLL